MNGTLIQTTTIVATKKNDSGCSSQPWPSQSAPRAVSRRLTSPYWVSNSHCHTTVVVRAAWPTPAGG